MIQSLSCQLEMFSSQLHDSCHEKFLYLEFVPQVFTGATFALSEVTIVKSGKGRPLVGSTWLDFLY